MWHWQWRPNFGSRPWGLKECDWIHQSDVVMWCQTWCRLKWSCFEQLHLTLSVFSRSSGSKVVKQEVPHTITEWIGTMFCTNPTSGLGVSPPATLKAFQPFFLSYTLPYSIIRGEKVTIPVTVFSYLPGCMVVSLILKLFNFEFVYFKIFLYLNKYYVHLWPVTLDDHLS